MCTADKYRSFTHSILSSLIENGCPNVENDPQYFIAFMFVINSITSQHHRAALKASHSVRGICESPITKILKTPMSLLQEASDPSIGVMIHLEYNKSTYKTTAN